MIYVTGDCHGDFSRFEEDRFLDLTKNDYVIICDDFGGIFVQSGKARYEKKNLKALNKMKFTTLFVDGNYENFNRLYSYPVIDWNGGKVHKISSSIFHLMRGEIFEIDGKKIFAFGGASCHDIPDGILNIDDKEYTLKEALLENRITIEEIIQKANKDFPNAISYDDGGSMEYHYENYTIIKCHTLNGNRDVYIGTKDMTLNDVL